MCVCSFFLSETLVRFQSWVVSKMYFPIMWCGKLLSEQQPLLEPEYSKVTFNQFYFLNNESIIYLLSAITTKCRNLRGHICHPGKICCFIGIDETIHHYIHAVTTDWMWEWGSDILYKWLLILLTADFLLRKLWWGDGEQLGSSPSSDLGQPRLTSCQVRYFAQNCNFARQKQLQIKEENKCKTRLLCLLVAPVFKSRYLA